MWESTSDIFFAIYITEENKFIGTLKIGSINELTKTADIGIIIGDKSEWGKGYATDAISLAVSYCFNDLKLRKVTSGLMELNPAMNRVFLKLGFVEEGRFRKQDFLENKYWDHVYLGCFKNEFKPIA